MPLVNSPEAENFMQLMGTDTGRKVLLGDKSKYHGLATNPIGFAQNALADAIPKFAALADDPTRTPVQQHDSARRLANRVATVFSDSKASLEQIARELSTEGEQMVEDRFLLDPNRHAIHSEIRGWIREHADKPDGIMKIREVALSNSEVITVLHRSPHFLTGLSLDTRNNIVGEGLKRFEPAGWSKIEHGQEIAALAARYPDAINKVHLYTYNPMMADQANRRVEV